MSKTRLTAYGLLLITSIIWGVAGPVIKNTLTDFPPLIFLTYRFGISSLIGLMFLAHAPQLLPNKSAQWLHVLIYSLCVPVFGLGLLFFGFNYTSSFTGSLIAATGPIFVVLAGFIFFKEKVTRMEKIGVSVALLGTLLTTIGADGNHGFMIVGSLMGNALVLLSRVIDAIGVAFAKKSLHDHISPGVITHVGFIIAFLVFLPIMLLSYSPQVIVTTFLKASPAAHFGVLYMAILSGTIGYFLFNRAEKTLHLGESGIFSYLTPIWALPVAMLWLGETITIPHIIGAIIIACGVVIAEYHKRKHVRK